MICQHMGLCTQTHAYYSLINNYSIKTPYGNAPVYNQLYALVGHTNIHMALICIWAKQVQAAHKHTDSL